MAFYKYTAYRTPGSQPKALAYLDEMYRTQHYWHDWVVARTLMEEQAKEYKQKHGCPIREARNKVWTDYFDLDQHSEGTNENIERISRTFSSILNRIDIPYFFCQITIAKGIFEGMTKKDAVQEFRDWLEADPNNGIIHEMKLHPDFSVSIIGEPPTPKNKTQSKDQKDQKDRKVVRRLKISPKGKKKK